MRKKVFVITSDYIAYKDMLINLVENEYKKDFIFTNDYHNLLVLERSAHFYMKIRPLPSLNTLKIIDKYLIAKDIKVFKLKDYLEKNSPKLRLV